MKDPSKSRGGTRFPWDLRGEVVQFDTPEQTQVEYRLAPFGARLLASALDMLIILAGSSSSAWLRSWVWS